MATNRSLIGTRVMVGVLVLLYILSLAWFVYGNYQAGDSAFWQLLISGILLSIPLILFYGAIGLLLVSARQWSLGQIDRRLAKLIYWSPRVAGILIILFVSLFALDVFAEGYTLGEMLLGFLMHMLPSIFMAILLAFAWRWEWIGFVAFLAAAIFFMRFAFGGHDLDYGVLLLFSGPMLVIALLFGVNWRWRKDLRSPLS